MRSLILSSVLVALGSAAFAAATVPRPAQPLDIVDSTGKHVVLANYKGKVVVVQFLLTTCPHCQAFSSQVLSRLQVEYGPKGFQAIGAAFGGASDAVTPAEAKEYATKYAQTFPVGPVARETLLTFMSLSVMDRFGAPQIAVIDRKGQIREQSLADINATQPLQIESHLRALIEKLLSEGAGTGAPSKSGASVTPKAPTAVAAAAK